MTGDKDDGNVNSRVCQLALKVEAVHSRKSHVEDKATWYVRALVAQEFLRRSEGLGMQANRLQHALDGRAKQIVVIEDKHGGDSCRRHSCASADRAENLKLILQLTSSLR